MRRGMRNGEKADDECQMADDECQMADGRDAERSNEPMAEESSGPVVKDDDKCILDELMKDRMGTSPVRPEPVRPRPRGERSSSRERRRFPAVTEVTIMSPAYSPSHDLAMVLLGTMQRGILESVWVE